MSFDFDISKMKPPCCAICEQDEGDRVEWYGNWVNQSHKSCIDALSNAQQPFYEHIHTLFTESKSMEFAFRIGVEEVQKKCEGLSLKQYLDKHGEEKLTKLFKEVAIPAAERHARGMRARL